MKFIHISDLHIGKRIHEFSMIEDQKYILEQITDIIEKEQADGVLIAGDIYDKSVPSAEAVQILDHFLTELSKKRVPVYVISGNHDSAERLSFGAKIMKESGIYISGIYDGEMKCVKMKDEYGFVYIHLLPFVKPALVRHVLEKEDICTYQEAVEAILEKSKIDPGKRNVLVAHQFVSGAGLCDSEEVSVGGLDQIDESVFADFDYVALGHIHGPQHMKKETIRYCGTPLKYSFSEAGHKKSVTVITLKEKGKTEIRTVPLIPRLDLRKIKGTYLEVSDRKAYTEENRYDYLQITLTDEEDIPNGMARLRAIYPNLMSLSYDNKRTRENQEIQGIQEQSQKSELELFGEFYMKLNNEPMKKEQEDYMKSLLQKLKEGEV